MVEITDEMVVRAARALCEECGHDPDDLEPGDIIIFPSDDLEKWMSSEGVDIETLATNGSRPPDGHDGKDPCHFMWRQFIKPARRALIAAMAD